MNTENKPSVSRRPVREGRRPFGSQTQKLAYPKRPGYHRHWFRSDDPGRVEAALAAGYTHVEDKEGKKVQQVTGVAVTGGPQISFLMEIPEEWYQEDMAAQQKQVDELDSAIKSGSVAGTPGQDGRYIPEHRGIKIREGNR